MPQESGYIHLDNGKLHYLRMGTGKQLLICFHGYGNDARLFSDMEGYVGAAYTIISIDLPHHGNSTEWADNAPMHKSDVVQLVNNLRETYNATRVSIAGYSIGGRVCLTIIEQMPEILDHVVLIAPDGLASNPLYSFVTRNFIGKRVFNNFLSNPQPYVRFVDWLKNKQLLNASRHKFIAQYLDAEDRRVMLSKVWPCMRYVVVRNKKIRRTIRQNHIQVSIFMGEHDKIIPAARAERFVKGVESATVYVLKKGHRVYDKETIPQIAECLL